MSVLETNASLDTSTKCQKYLKNLLNVSSSQTSWRNSGCFSNNTRSLLSDRPYHWGTDHSDWTGDNCCTTRRLYNSRHSCRCPCHYHDPWWKMTYHDDNQGNHQRYLSKEKKAEYRCSIIFRRVFASCKFHFLQQYWISTLIYRDRTKHEQLDIKTD